MKHAAPNNNARSANQGSAGSRRQPSHAAQRQSAQQPAQQRSTQQRPRVSQQQRVQQPAQRQQAYSQSAGQQRVPQQQTAARQGYVPQQQQYAPQQRMPQQQQYAAVAPVASSSPASQQPKKKRRLWLVVAIIAAVVFVVSAAVLGFIAFKYYSENQQAEKLANEVLTMPSDPTGTSLSDLTVDWAALRAINPEVVGWIMMPDTPINYPVVQAADNEKYLNTNFGGQTMSQMSFGAIFLDAGNTPDFTDDVDVLYGHNMNDGTMFTTIEKMKDQSFFDSHREIYLLTPKGNLRLQAFSLLHVPADELIVQTRFATAADKQRYVQDKIDRNIVQADCPDPASIDTMVAFSTCDNLASDGRYILFAAVVESTVPGIESITNYGAVANPKIQEDITAASTDGA